MPKARASIYVYSSTLFSISVFKDEMICVPRTARYVVRNQAETAQDAESTGEHQRTVYSSTRCSGSSLILSCLTVSVSCGIVYSRVKITPESEKKQMSVYLIKRKIKKKMLVYVQGTYISPFVLALEGGVNSNPSRRERLFLRTANPRQDQNTYMADTKRATAHSRPGPERGVAAYRRTPEREQSILYPNHL